MIKRIKIASIWINPEKEITSKQPKTLGQKYKVVEVNIKVADDSKEYAGKYIKGSFFEYKDKVDASKNRTATEKADYFKKENDGKEVILEVIESQSTGKDGKVYDNLNFKTLSKAKKEVAEQLLK
jgi:hypothetical protein